MTTIAYRDGIMAADTAKWDVNGVYFGRSSKLKRLKDGRVLGGAGSTSMILRVVNWLNGDADKPVPDDDKDTDRFQAIIATPCGTLVYVDQSLTEMEQHKDEFVAIGSGRELALGAMAMGASATEAVRVATEFDSHSRPPIDALVV